MDLFENLQSLTESEEIKTFNISFKRNDVYQANLIKGYSEEQVTDYFKSYKPDAEILGVKIATSDDMKPGKPVIDTTKEIVEEAKSSSKSNVSKMTYRGQKIQNQDWAEYKIGTYVEIINPLNNKSLDIKMGISGYGKLAGKVKDTYVYNDGADNMTSGGSNHNYHELNPSAAQSCLIEVHDDFKLSQHNTKTNRIIIPVEYLKEISEKEYKDIVNKIPRKGFDKLFNKNKTRIESKIIKDEKDIEQIVEGKEIKTEDYEDSKELFANKTKKFADKIDTLAHIIDEDELHEFLSSLSPDLDMDVYTSGELYPSSPDGYLSNGSLDELNLNDEYDVEEFNWVNEQLDDSIIKLDEKIKSTIEDLENKIKSIEQDISNLKSVVTL